MIVKALEISRAGEVAPDRAFAARVRRMRRLVDDAGYPVAHTLTTPTAAASSFTSIASSASS